MFVCRVSQRVVGGKRNWIIIIVARDRDDSDVDGFCPASDKISNPLIASGVQLTAADSLEDLDCRV